jgi:hypothetical protein
MSRRLFGFLVWSISVVLSVEEIDLGEPIPLGTPATVC